jgi:hypothetical protein
MKVTFKIRFIIFFILLLQIISYSAIAQSKKEQISILNYQLDSLKQNVEIGQTKIREFEAQLISVNKNLNELLRELMITKRSLAKEDSLKVIFENELKSVTKKLLLSEEKSLQMNNAISSYKIEIDDLKNELTKRDSLISIYEKQSILDKDSILLLNTSIANLKNENQDSSLRNSNDFSIFLKYFISKVYSEKNFDSLVYHESVILRTFINTKLGIFRTFNPGIYRTLYGKNDDWNYGYNFHEGYNGEIEPNISNFLIYSNKLPEGGFCDEATSPDGIYYNQVFETPTYDDAMNGKSYSTTAKYKNFNKKIVVILKDKFIKQTLYFIEVNKKWYLLFIDDCDCSA